jgi:hypothetical protein
MGHVWFVSCAACLMYGLGDVTVLGVMSCNQLELSMRNMVLGNMIFSGCLAVIESRRVTQDPLQWCT